MLLCTLLHSVRNILNHGLTSFEGPPYYNHGPVFLHMIDLLNALQCIINNVYVANNYCLHLGMQ